MSEFLASIPMWVYDWTGGIFFMISLWFFFYKLPKAWHWSNASLLPYFLLFVATEMYMLAGLQVIYLLFGGHGWVLWKLQQIGSSWAKAWEKLAIPFGGIVFIYTVYITEFVDAWAWLQFTIVSISIVGSVLLVLKYKEAWLVYIGANILGLVYYPHNGLWALTIVQIGAIVMSVAGYWLWKKQDEFQTVIGDRIV